MNFQFRCKKLLLQGMCLIIFNLFSCGGGVDEETMYALNNLKAEVESLRAQIKAKEDEKASIQKQISDKDAKIKKCSDDFQKTKKAIEYFLHTVADIPIIIVSNVKSEYFLIDSWKWESPEYLNNPVEVNNINAFTKYVYKSGYTPDTIYVNLTNYMIIFRYKDKFGKRELIPQRYLGYKSNPQVRRFDF